MTQPLASGSQPAPHDGPDEPTAAPGTAPVSLPDRLELAERVNDPAHRAFGLALWVSAIRCSLLYVVLPIAGPALGLTSTPALPLFLALHAAGIYTSGRSLRRAYVGRKWGLAAISLVLLAINLVSLSLR